MNSLDNFSDTAFSSDPLLLFSVDTSFNFLEEGEGRNGEDTSLLSKSPNPGHNSLKLIIYSAFKKSPSIKLGGIVSLHIHMGNKEIKWSLFADNNFLDRSKGSTKE